MKKMESLKGKIEEYILKNGSNKIKEVELARRFKVSRTPIREVLKNLEERGIIVRRKKGGTRLKEITLKDLNEIYEIRKVLEGLAANLLCENITGKIIKELVKIDKKNLSALRENNRILAIETDIEFHAKIVNSCGNERLIKLIRDIHLLTQAFRINYKIVPSLRHTKKNPYSHKKIIEALKERNAEKAERISRRHVEWAKNYMIRIFLTQQIQEKKF